MTTNGELYCWGDNEYGKVGNGTRDTQLTPVKVLSSVKCFTAYDTNKAITANGDLYCWGLNSYGQVGNGTTVNQLTPLKY